jgi:hypothetical protein
VQLSPAAFSTWQAAHCRLAIGRNSLANDVALQLAYAFDVSAAPLMV